MTLDEAIKNEEEIAIQQIEHANALDNIPLFGMSKDDIEEIKECYKCSKEHEQLAEWLKDYKRLLEQTRWIPVSESGRLPEDGLYLVTTSKGQVQVHVFNHNGNSEEYWMRCNKAWMPLPLPYKESPTGSEEVEE